MIKIKNHEITEDTIASLNAVLKKDISPKIAFRLLELTTSLTPIVANKNNLYNKMLLAYGERRDNNSYEIKEEYQEKFNTYYTELLNIEHTFNMDKIDFDELGLDTKIKPSDLNNLLFLFNFTKLETTSSESSLLDEFKKNNPD